MMDIRTWARFLFFKDDVYKSSRENNMTNLTSKEKLVLTYIAERRVAVTFLQSKLYR